MITFVSKKNNLGQDDIKGISGVLKVRLLFCTVQLVCTNFPYPYQMLSFDEISHLLGHFGALTIRSVFRNALVNGYIS